LKKAPQATFFQFTEYGAMRTKSLIRLTACAILTATLAACGGVQIKPETVLPKPIIVTMPAHVGFVLPNETRNYAHTETRWGVDWTVQLGEGHRKMMLEVLKDEFSEVREYKDMEAARAAPDLKAIFEPVIENYSFVTARETNGRYYACTIRYRINVYSPAGEKVDSLTLTGYCNALAKGISSGKPLQQASISAMRDAAAKFLVQFPEQSVGERLARNEAVTLENKVASSDAGGIETVPIEETAPTTVDATPVTGPNPVTGPSAPVESPAPPTPPPAANAPKAS
jgi:hypothetical protein